MALRRVAILLATATLAIFLPAAPAQAKPGYLCLTATATPTGGDTYTLSHTGCTGSGIYDVPVLVFSGPAAGNYVCGHVTYYPMSAEFEGTDCVRT